VTYITGNQTNSLRVSLSRRVSSKRSESTQCHDFEYFDGYHIFYCHQLDVDEVLTSNYRPGFDAKFVDIIGELYIDDSCDFTNIVKVYSYPGDLINLYDMCQIKSTSFSSFILIFKSECAAFRSPTTIKP
jgi:hypothetical protein